MSSITISVPDASNLQAFLRKSKQEWNRTHVITKALGGRSRKFAEVYTVVKGLTHARIWKSKYQLTNAVREKLNNTVSIDTVKRYVRLYWEIRDNPNLAKEPWSFFISF
jgi:hypothetical protein